MVPPPEVARFLPACQPLCLDMSCCWAVGMVPYSANHQARGCSWTDSVGQGLLSFTILAESAKYVMYDSLFELVACGCVSKTMKNLGPIPQSCRLRFSVIKADVVTIAKVPSVGWLRLPKTVSMVGVSGGEIRPTRESRVMITCSGSLT